MLGEDAPLQGVPLLPRHRAHVQGIGRLLVLGLLQLPAIDKLDVGDGYRSGLAGVLVGEPAAQRGQNSRKIIVERGRCAFSDGESGFLGAAACSRRAEWLLRG